MVYVPFVKPSPCTLHGSPVVRQEGYCISQVSKMFDSCAVAIVLRPVAAGYVVTCQVLQAPKHRYLAAELISHEEINHDNLVKGSQNDVPDHS
uniref:Uncharacterized protein n=1 Tax=Arundo donax TaxID=35708 RepID=A0A0A9F0W3_ARUDO